MNKVPSTVRASTVPPAPEVAAAVRAGGGGKLCQRVPGSVRTPSVSRPAEPAAPSCSGWFRHHRHHRSPPQHPVSEARDHPGIDSDAHHWVSRSKSRSRRRQDRPRGTGSLPTRRQSPAKAVSHDVRNSGWRVTDICRNMAARVPGTPWPSRPCQKPRPGHDCRTAIPVKKRPMTTGSPGRVAGRVHACSARATSNPARM